jgi:undecaprenyl diphosphate synthase
VREALRSAIAATRNNTGMTVILAVSYGGREEIVRAARSLARRVQRGELEADRITEDVFAQQLGTAGIPDPDLLIRTSGEMRISNFFLWQLAYTELYVTDTLWPDFREREYLQALALYQQRERRFGRTSAQVDGAERLRAV